MLFYTDSPGATITTNGSANTTDDCMFIAPGASRSCWLQWVLAWGKSSGATSLTNITIRLEKWTATASSGGSAITPTPNDPGYQAAKHTAGFSASAVTPGTGGPLLLAAFGFGPSSQSGWGNPTGQATNLDAAYALQAGATQSIDLFNISPGISQPLECSLGVAE